MSPALRELPQRLISNLIALWEWHLNKHNQEFINSWHNLRCSATEEAMARMCLALVCVLGWGCVLSRSQISRDDVPECRGVFDFYFVLDRWVPQSKLQALTWASCMSEKTAWLPRYLKSSLSVQIWTVYCMPLSMGRSICVSVCATVC